MRLARPSPRLAALPLLALAACGSPGPGASFDERDPFRGTNEAIHDFNVGADRYVLRPISQGYEFVTPEVIQVMLGNAFNHLDTINDFANYLFQGELDSAGVALGRFTINTVLGGAGLLDPATEFGLPKEDTDFDVTLGKYGVPEGAFLMLPLLGPTTTRGIGGFVGDAAVNPLTYSGFTNVDAFSFVNPALNAGSTIHERAVNADLIDDILYESENSYVSLRTVFLQRRDALILGADGADATLPDIFDEEPTN